MLSWSSSVIARVSRLFSQFYFLMMTVVLMLIVIGVTVRLRVVGWALLI